FDTYSARGILKNGVACELDTKELIEATGVSEQELFLAQAMKEEELDKIDPIYISYFIPWNSFENYKTAKKFGFCDLEDEWRRQHHVEDFDQVDTRAYLIHPWMKYPKFAHASATDYAARMVRYGIISRDEALELVKRHDAFLDPLCVRDFCEFLGYTKEEFWNIMDKQYNKDFFEKKNGKWELKKPVE
ncbi:N-acetyl sugar amidotransferase, partial [bacterium]|nr:N-acetyl sugar amidotransferase [bacterium]